MPAKKPPAKPAKKPLKKPPKRSPQKTSPKPSAKQPAKAAATVWQPARSLAPAATTPAQRAARKSALLRSLSLLWSPPDVPGRSGLSLRAIVDRALIVADAQGLEAVSMRRLADTLGVGTMSLYTHVPGKALLTDLMIDAALRDLYVDLGEPARAGGWRAGLNLIAAKNRALWLAHPWLLDVVGTRPVLGPQVALKYEAELRALEGSGLTDVEADATLTLVLSHVEAVVRAARTAAHTVKDTGLSDVEWWEATAPFLARVMSATDLPVSSRVGQAAGAAHQGLGSPDFAFSFGLERILDGVAALIASRAARL